MRLLYVTNGFPWPLTSGYLRHFFLIRELAGAGHQVTLLSVVGADHSPEDRTPLTPFAEEIFTFASLDRSSRKLGKAARRITGEPAARAMGATIRALVSSRHYDACVFSGKRTYAALGALPPGLPVVADLCDATSARMRTALRAGPARRAPVVLVDLAQVRRVERQLIGAASHILFASTRDRDVLVPLAHPARRRTTIVPNGVDPDYWRRRSPELGTAVVLTGAMNYPPNEDAALHLLTEVLPRVRRQESGVELLLVGRDPTPRLVAAANQVTGVVVSGFVDDVRPWLERAAVFAAALRQGAGIQNKVLEAMSMEIPVVASPLAANGVRAGDAGLPPVTVADGAEATAAALVERIRAARCGSPPDATARSYVEANFSWRRSGELLEEALRHSAGVGCGSA